MEPVSRLQRVLEAGQFAVTSEVGPPKGTDPTGVTRKGARLKDYCDAINVTDNQTAIVRLSSLAGCALLRQVGVETVMQIVCRDRNRIAIQSDVLGAIALGIRNFLCLSGDHQMFGNHPTAKNVFDLDSIQLIAALKKMRDEKKFLCGDDISGEVPMFIGAAENPFADPFEFRAVRLAVYNIPKFARFMEMVRERGLDKDVHILAGIIPLRSAGMARYMQSSVPGCFVPDDVVERMKGAKVAKEEGIKIALEDIEQLRQVPGVHGIHIMAVGWEEEAVPALVEKSGLYPRPS